MADAIIRIKSFISRPTANGHYLVPQYLIDEAFNQDHAAAKQWFMEAGLALNLSSSNSVFPISNVGQLAVASRLRSSTLPSGISEFGATDEQPAANAMEGIRTLLAKCGANQSVRVPQELIDDAFESDEQAEKWLGVFGYTLIIGRLRGKPSLATIIYRPSSSDGASTQKVSRNGLP